MIVEIDGKKWGVREDMPNLIQLVNLQDFADTNLIRLEDLDIEIADVTVRQQLKKYLGSAEHYGQLLIDYGWNKCMGGNNYTKLTIAKTEFMKVLDEDGVVKWFHYPQDHVVCDAHGSDAASLWKFLNIPMHI